MKIFALTCLGIITSLLLLYFALPSSGEIDQVIQLDWSIPQMGVAALCYALFFVVKAWRWRIMLTETTLGTTTLLPYILTGYAGNILVPMQMGEALRAGLIRQHHQLSGSRLLSGILIEKGLDVLCVVVILFVALVFSQQSAPLPQEIVSLTMVLSVLGVLAGLSAIWQARWWVSQLQRLEQHYRHNNISQLIAKLVLAGQQMLDYRQRWSTILFTSLLMWLLILLTLYFCLQAAGLATDWTIAALVMFATTAGLFLPTSPGFVGTLQAAFLFVLLPLGYPANQIILASVLYNLLITLPPLLAGIIAYSRIKNPAKLPG